MPTQVQVRFFAGKKRCLARSRTLDSESNERWASFRRQWLSSPHRLINGAVNYSANAHHHVTVSTSELLVRPLSTTVSWARSGGVQCELFAGSADGTTKLISYCDQLAIATGWPFIMS